ncbi:YidH family protein [Arthrobacter sp. NyZ413]|uniref:YidH family protein n=1 Tax=Arthrobacter sp. NyZ413 TaxID=3144669 RepID=UPI003BF85874
MKLKEPLWRREGQRPDYRFSLANERTFLAWIRTALAILAGAIGIDQLAPEIAPTPVRISLCIAFAVIGALLALEAYRRWSLQEQAMRNNRELPHAWLLVTMAIIVATAAAVLAILILLAK